MSNLLILGTILIVLGIEFWLLHRHLDRIEEIIIKKKVE